MAQALGQRVKMPSVTLASPVQVLAPLLLIQLLGNAPEKAVEDDTALVGVRSL